MFRFPALIVAATLVSAASFGAAALTLSASAAPPKPAEKAEKPVRQLHWRTEMSGAVLQGVKFQWESWVRGEDMRLVLDMGGTKQTFIARKGIIYMVAGNLAVKTSVSNEARPWPRPVDYVVKLDEMLAQGKKVGEEMVDGEVCAKWEVMAGANASKPTTIWVSPSLRFPRQVKLPSDDGEIVMRNHSIEMSVELSDALFTPEKREYRDMTVKPTPVPTAAATDGAAPKDAARTDAPVPAPATAPR